MTADNIFTWRTHHKGADGIHGAWILSREFAGILFYEDGVDFA